MAIIRLIALDFIAYFASPLAFNTSYNSAR